MCPPVRSSALVVLVLTVALVGGCAKKPSSEMNLDRANAEFAAGHYDNAEVEFEGYLNSHPSDRDTMVKLGALYFFQGRWLQAASMLAQADANGATDFDTNLRLAQCRARFSQWTEAMSRGERAVKARPDNEDAWIVFIGGVHDARTMERAERAFAAIAQAHPGLPSLDFAQALFALKKGDNARAESALRAVIQASSRSAPAWEQLARLLAARGDVAEAEKAFAQSASLSSPRSPRRLAYAQFEIEHNQDAKGQAVLDGMIAEAPDFVPALAAAANLAFKQGRNSDCLKILQRVLARDPINYDALMMKANLALLSEHPRDALPQFQHVDDIYPDVANVKLQLALAYTRLGDLQTADNYLKQAVLQDPGFEPAAILLATTDLGKGDLANAQTVLLELLRRKPQTARAYSLLGSVYLQQQDLDHALGVYRALQRIEPRNAEAIYLEASVLARQGKADEARKALERSVATDPGYAAGVEGLVDMDLSDNAVAAAVARVDRLQSRFPKSATPWLLRAKIALALKRTPDAEADFQKAIELEPKQANAYLLLANLYVQTKEYPRAIQKLTAIVESTHNIRALMELATIRSQLQQYREAAADYEQVVKLDPTFAAALNNLAYLYSENLHEPDKAIAYARRARQMAPTNPSTADTLGWALFRRGDHAEAFTLILEAADQLPGDAEVRYHLGMVESMLGDPASARVALESALRNSAGDSWAATARERLALLDNSKDAPADETDLKRRLEATPNDPVLRARLAELELAAGRPEGSAEQFEQALKINPRNTAVMLRLARIYAEDLHRPDQALDMAKRVHVMEPSNIDGCRLLGHLLFQAGKYSWSRDIYGAAGDSLSVPERLELAEDDFNCGQAADAAALVEDVPGRAAALLRACFPAADDPALAATHEKDAAELLRLRPHSIVGRLILAEAVESGGRLEDAVHRYENLVAEAPALYTAYFRLATLHGARLGNAQAAYEYASRAKALRADDPRVLNLLASISYQRGDYDRAAVAAQESIAVDPGNSVAHYYLGLSKMKLGHADLGESELRTALAQGLDGDLAANARKNLAR